MNLKKLNDMRQMKEQVVDGVPIREFYVIGANGPGGRQKHLLFAQAPTIKDPDPMIVCTVACDEGGHAIMDLGADLDDLTCAKCQKVLARIKTNLARKK